MKVKKLAKKGAKKQAKRQTKKEIEVKKKTFITTSVIAHGYQTRGMNMRGKIID
jgi:hypothetical protein